MFIVPSVTNLKQSACIVYCCFVLILLVDKVFEIVVWPMIDIILQKTVLGCMDIRHHMYIDCTLNMTVINFMACHFSHRLAQIANKRLAEQAK